MAAWSPAIGGDPKDLTFVVPWADYQRLVRGRPLSQWFLEERATRLSAMERSWLEAQARSWISIWEVTGVVPGARTSLTDLLSGESREVIEKSASSSTTSGGGSAPPPARPGRRRGVSLDALRRAP